MTPTSEYAKPGYVSGETEPNWGPSNIPLAGGLAGGGGYGAVGSVASGRGAPSPIRNVPQGVPSAVRPLTVSTAVLSAPKESLTETSGHRALHVPTSSDPEAARHAARSGHGGLVVTLQL